MRADQGRGPVRLSWSSRSRPVARPRQRGIPATRPTCCSCSSSRSTPSVPGRPSRLGVARRSRAGSDPGAGQLGRVPLERLGLRPARLPRRVARRVVRSPAPPAGARARTSNRDLEKKEAEMRREAAKQERARIAREMHDVVAHSVSVRQALFDDASRTSRAANARRSSRWSAPAARRSSRRAACWASFAATEST